MKFSRLKRDDLFRFAGESSYINWESKKGFKKVGKDKYIVIGGYVKRLTDPNVTVMLLKDNPFRVSTRRVYKVEKKRGRIPGRLTYKERSTALKHVRNPRETLIYPRLLRIEAQKGRIHRCDAECLASNHKYYHNFKRGSKIYGMPNGSLVIR